MALRGVPVALRAFQVVPFALRAFQWSEAADNSVYFCGKRMLFLQKKLPAGGAGSGGITQRRIHLYQLHKADIQNLRELLPRACQPEYQPQVHLRRDHTPNRIHRIRTSSCSIILMEHAAPGYSFLSFSLNRACKGTKIFWHSQIFSQKNLQIVPFGLRICNFFAILIKKRVPLFPCGMKGTKNF